MNNRLSGIGLDDRSFRKPRFVAVSSGKGGVGKSVIAYNLADHLSVAVRVLLVDSDFFAGNLHILANIVPQNTPQKTDPASGIVFNAVTPIHKNLDLLTLGDQALPDMKNLAMFLKNLRTQAAGYDFVVFDTATGILPQTTLILYSVDEVILVTTAELTSISNSYALYKVLTGAKTHPAVALLVNQEDRPEELAYINDKFNSITRQFLGHTPGCLGGLGYDRAMVDAVARQTGIRFVAPENRLTAAFAALAGRLAAGTKVDQITPETINNTALEADIRE
ncbi:MAG: AAA family ATPase [candidate division Zixibacteria bacterium]|nr:AAA family ATPase [candidate division Zixibacteria bacterium]